MELIKHEHSGLLVYAPEQPHLAETLAGIAAPLYVDEAQSKELANALLHILSDEEYGSRLAENAYNTFMIECSMEANIKKLEDLYLSCLPDNRRKSINKEKSRIFTDPI